MDNSFYVVFNAYCPNCAPINRLLSYLKAWSELDVNITLVFMLPDRNFSRLSIPYKNVTVIYMWDCFKGHSYLLHNIFYYLFVKKFIRTLNKGDRVYLYDQFYLAKHLLKKKEISIFMEITEHPDVFNPGHWPYRISVNKFLQISKLLDGLFVISRPLKDYFVENGVDESRIDIINMTVDPSRYIGVERDDFEHQYIAYCGTASNRKDGVDQLIQSFSLLSRKYPNLYLYIIGSVSPDDSNVLLARQLNIDDKVVFTGMVPYSDMPRMLTNAIILALARPDNKQAKYGFPTKLGEYLLTANPVVVTDVGDIPHFIVDGENGMVAKADDINSFSEKLDWLISHPNEAKKIGERGRETALALFNCNKEAKKIVNYIFKTYKI